MVCSLSGAKPLPRSTDLSDGHLKNYEWILKPHISSNALIRAQN